MLLIATMLRLALNLASTRLILSRGHEGTDAAGHVIEAFGNFVMSGNFVINPLACPSSSPSSASASKKRRAKAKRLCW